MLKTRTLAAAAAALAIAACAGHQHGGPGMGGGMQRIDPPATDAAPRESILDSIDSGVGKTPLAK